MSKFKPVELPAEGAPVRLELDSKGFIRTCGRDKPIWAVIYEGHPFPTADSSSRERSACEAHVDDAINRALAHHAFPDAKAIASGCSCVGIPAPGRNQN